MRKSIRLFITGSIQGIFFRQYIKDQADKNKINGYVRSLEDGRVEIFIEGIVDNVNSMVQICKTGPPHAKVRSVEEKPVTFQGFKEFKILSI